MRKNYGITTHDRHMPRKRQPERRGRVRTTALKFDFAFRFIFSLRRDVPNSESTRSFFNPVRHNMFTIHTSPELFLATKNSIILSFGHARGL